MKSLIVTVAAFASLVVPCTIAVAPPAAASNATTPAWFEDHWIDIASDWEGATACDVGAAEIVCYRDEATMDRAIDAQRSVVGRSSMLAAFVCGSSLRLYDGTSYTGVVLLLSTRLLVLNLSVYGFDNRTSSYKVGGCDSDFYSGANLGGSLYPGNTSAGAQASSMLAGWSNAVSSVYLY